MKSNLEPVTAAVPPAPEATPPESVSPLYRILHVGIRAGILIVLVSAAVFAFSLPSGTWSYLQRFHWEALPLAVGLVMMAWLAYGSRVWLLARVLGNHPTFRQSLQVSLATEFGIAATPGGVGGIVVRLALQKRLGITRTETASMIAADLTADAIYFAVLWPLGAVALWKLLTRTHLDETLRDRLLPAAPWVAAALVAAFVFLMIGRRWWRRRRGDHAPHKHRLAAWRRAARRFKLNLIRIWRHGKGAFALTVVAASIQWTCRYGVLPVLLWGFGFAADPLPLMLLQGLLYIIAVSTVLPGGGGSVEVLSALVLPLLVPAGAVGAIVLLWRLMTYHLYLVVGGLVLWLQLPHPASPPATVRVRRTRRSTKR